MNGFFDWVTTPEGQTFLSNSPGDFPLQGPPRENPMDFIEPNFGGYFATSAPPLVSTPTNVWGTIANLGSQAIAAFGKPQLPAPTPMGTPFPLPLGTQTIPANSPESLALAQRIYQVQAGAWGKCALPSQARRRKAKVVMLPDGTQTIVPYCAPRRMNPLNPRALRRSAVRIGRFHAIAKNIEKLVQKACKTSMKRRTTSSRCYTKKC